MFNKMRYINQLYLLFLISIFAVLQSCTDGDNIIGKDILPPSDEVLLDYSEGFAIESYTLSIDSLISDDGAFSSARPYNLLGSYNDPVFGQSDAGFLTEVRLSKNQVNFEDDFVPDSLVLSLELKSIYGEPRQSGPLEIFVYQLSDSIELDSSYASNMDASPYFDEASPLAHFQYAPLYIDSVLTIRIDNQELLDIFKDTFNLYDNENFKKVFYGFYLKTGTITNSGSIVAFNLLSELSKLSLHYHYYTGSPIVSPSERLQFDLLINEKCARINLFDHDYQNAQSPIQHIDDPQANDTLIYVQAMAGLKSKISFPNIEQWAESIKVGSGNLAITRARLYIPVLENSTDKYTPPPSLNLFNINDDGEEENFPDLISNGTLYSEYFNGLYNEDISAYEFNIAQYIQKVISGEIPNNGFYIAPYLSTNISSANRVILKSGSAVDGIKLYISYIGL
ncbi:MAG: DUF4270 domain-containing protein [Bacteroidales bacterium]|nr:DUF4270 domain-containing protein [Bacteroidales bacterium]MCF8455375.1 DUF4270 domain-containing protein [Bacteroidales bacterium]